MSLSSLSNRVISVVFIAAGVSLLAFISVLTGLINPPVTGREVNYQPGITLGNIFADIGPGPFDSDQQIKKFSSYNELKVFLKDVQAYSAKLNDVQSNYGGLREGGGGSYYGGGSGLAAEQPSGGFAALFAPPQQMQSSANTVTNADSAESLSQENTNKNDFSGTNVQVTGVDEADFLKTDGKYAYIVSGSKLTIIDAYPPEQAKIVSKVGLDIPEGQTLQNMFLNGDKIVVFYQEYIEQRVIPEYGYAPTSVYAPSTHALVIDVSDRENPSVSKNYEVSGEYSNSRMLGSKIFLLTSSGVDYDNPVVPSVRESSAIVSAPDVYYFGNPEQSYAFNTVAAIDLEAIGGKNDNENCLLSKTFMIGSGSTVYVSENNIYIAYQRNLPHEYLQKNNKDKFANVIVPLLPTNAQNQIKSIEENQSLDSTQKWERVSVLLQDAYDSLSPSEQAQLFSKMQRGIAEYDSAIVEDSQKTLVHKISISANSILGYVAKGEVPGRLLNQFSMDEHEGKLRIASTSEYSTPERFVMHNNVYTLDNEMKIVGKLEGIAPDESIYAARFMGDRLYLVTFRQTDPFFVIDLSGDEPEALGKLKLPGFSNYLHPYDKDHIIGIGKETSDNGAQVLGVKIALFDVSDVSHPEALDTYTIDGPQTESEALNDHKALLIDKGKDILSIPIFSHEQYYYPNEQGSKGAAPYIEPRTWNGFYVFGIDDEKHFELKGQIQHETSNNYGSQGSRSFYINDTLYTVTPTLMKMNDLRDMDEINHISLDGTGALVRDYLVQ